MRAKFIIKGNKPQLEITPETADERIMLTDLLTHTSVE